jgi:sec-independent protein translocase protein TatA
MTLLAYGFSPFTLLIVMVIILLLFGNRLPATMRSLGRGVTEFKKGLEGQGGEDDEADQKKVKQDKDKQD